MGNKLFKIKKEDFDEISFDSAVVLSKFDTTGETPVAKEDVICVTTGDISVSCVPRIQDMGEDVNGCPPNLAELVRVFGWDCKVSFTALTASTKVIKEALGAADIASTKITPRTEIKPDDFTDRWIVAEKIGGGVVAVHLKKSMSSSGLSLRTTKNGKGQMSVELTGHPSIDDDDPLAPPIEFYSTAAAGVGG